MSSVSNYKINISAPNLINICVDNNEQKEISGRLYHCYQEEPVLFANVVELIREIESLFDRIAFPQASTKTRSFGENAQPNSGPVVRPEKVVPQDQVILHNGQRGTFITCVKFRQNSTWQGETYWKEKNQQMRFTNLLEFIRQVDLAVDGEVL